MSSGERGATTALVATLLMTLGLALMGTGVERGRWRLARQELYHIADLAATAGLGALDPGGTFIGQPRLDAAQARALAEASVQRNLGLLQHDWLLQPSYQVRLQLGPPPSILVTIQATVRGTFISKRLSVAGGATVERAR